MIDSHDFRIFFMHGLINSTIKPFFFETPPVNYETFHTIDFEFVLVKTDALENIKVDFKSFSEYFSSSQAVTVFPNLGKDAKLVVPCPIGSADLWYYAHFASFLEYGCTDQVEQLLKEAANALIEEVKIKYDNFTWLSTSGLGVSWVHIRLDSTPKYYNYKPYKLININL